MTANLWVPTLKSFVSLHRRHGHHTSTNPGSTILGTSRMWNRYIVGKFRHNIADNRWSAQKQKNQLSQPTTTRTVVQVSLDKQSFLPNGDDRSEDMSRSVWCTSVPHACSEYQDEKLHSAVRNRIHVVRNCTVHVIRSKELLRVCFSNIVGSLPGIFENRRILLNDAWDTR